MADDRLILSAHMRALVQRFGCFDAVAETIGTRWGVGYSKGTISRKAAGSLEWGVLDVVALEDALGAYPVTRMLERRRATAAALGPHGAINAIAQVGLISRETGEAVASILAAEQSDCAGDRAQAVKEIDEAVAALIAARAHLTGGGA